MPAVGQREPCPCGSGKRYKACHGRSSGPAFVARPFAGLADETEWVALREVVPSATAPLRVAGYEDREVLLSTVLPGAEPVRVRPDGPVLLGLQVPPGTGDVSLDLAGSLLLALDPTCERPNVRLQDLLTADPLRVTVQPDFGWWLADGQDDQALLAARERADTGVAPTARLASVASAYWGSDRGRAYLRWVLPEDEEPLLDALARLAARDGLGVGPGSRYLGCLRAHGLLVPVWDLPPDTPAERVEEPAAALRARLDQALAEPGPLTAAQRRARAGLLSRQLTLR